MNTNSENFRHFVLNALEKRTLPSSLASFAFRADDSLMIEKIKKLSFGYEKSFYWEKPSEGTLALALGELVSISESGKGRFAAIEKKIKTLREGFISNWDETGIDQIPLFVGGDEIYARKPHGNLGELFRLQLVCTQGAHLLQGQ